MWGWVEFVPFWLITVAFILSNSAWSDSNFCVNYRLLCLVQVFITTAVASPKNKLHFIRKLSQYHWRLAMIAYQDQEERLKTGRFITQLQILCLQQIRISTCQPKSEWDWETPIIRHFKRISSNTLVYIEKSLHIKDSWWYPSMLVLKESGGNGIYQTSFQSSQST